MKALFQVTIIGFPNVGKSTLFNRLLRQKKALVHSLPGMTRDTVSAVCSLEGKKFLLTDTGGLADHSADSLAAVVKEKAWKEGRKADLILLVLDGKRELLPGEEELYRDLRQAGKSIIVVLNKVDSITQEENIGDFYNRLREREIIPVSAEHKRNLDLLEENLVHLVPEPPSGKDAARPLRIAIIGRINVGKSSLINRLCGEDRLIVSSSPGTTRDSTDTLIVRNKKIYCLMDTAGLRKLSRTRDKQEKASIVKAKKDIALADVLCLIMDAQEFPTRRDTAIAHLAQESGKPLLLALNKWDLVPGGDPSREYRSRAYRKMPFASYAPILLVSAKTGKRVAKVLDLSEEVYAASSMKVETSQLNEFVTWVNQTHPPLSKAKKRMKIKYMVQKGVKPPTFLLFTRGGGSFFPSYERFFLQLLRERFGFWGTPLRIRLRRD